MQQARLESQIELFTRSPKGHPLTFLRQGGFKGCRVPILIDRGKYVLKTAETTEEVEAALRLRYGVFHAEYDIPRDPYGIDIDSFDFICDHLIVKEKALDEVVGTYRLISSTFSDEFYSETEFDLRSFLWTPGNKLELGRGCVAPLFRRGAVLGLLWKGVMEYARQMEAQWVFGCSSVRTINPYTVSLLRRSLRESGSLCDQFWIRPKPAYQMPFLSTLDDANTQISAEEKQACAREHIPALLDAYLRTGARLSSEPALDQEFNCVDFFTVMNMENIKETRRWQ